MDGADRTLLMPWTGLATSNGVGSRKRIGTSAPHLFSNVTGHHAQRGTLVNVRGGVDSSDDMERTGR